MRAVAVLLLFSASFVAPAAAQIDPQTALLQKTGWDALTAGHAGVAAEAFRAAIRADPKNARLHLGAGTAAYLERRDEDATRALERALELDPKLSEARVLIGRVLYRAGDLVGAIRMYERVVADAPSDKQSRAAMSREGTGAGVGPAQAVVEADSR